MSGGLKRLDLKPCVLCWKGLAHAGIPFFWRVRLQMFGLDARAIQRRHGMEEMFGGGNAGAALAQVMGTDDDLAKPIGEEQQGLVCATCAADGRPHFLSRLSESIEERREKANAEKAPS